MACSGCNQNTSASSKGNNSNILSQKLGKCKQCIVIAITGTILSWILFTISLFATCESCRFPYLIWAITGMGALAFSGVLIAHTIAYFRKK